MNASLVVLRARKGRPRRENRWRAMDRRRCGFEGFMRGTWWARASELRGQPSPDSWKTFVHKGGRRIAYCSRPTVHTYQDLEPPIQPTRLQLALNMMRVTHQSFHLLAKPPTTLRNCRPNRVFLLFAGLHGVLHASAGDLPGVIGKQDVLPHSHRNVY